jgi:sarcosine oxidase
VRASDAEVVVVGAGVMGAATARALSRSGREVLLLEQFELGHDRGSSHGASRVFRLSYGDPTYVRMAQDALPLWRELEEEAGRPLLVTTGGFDIGPGAVANAAALEACGAGFERLNGRAATERFPVLSLPPEAPALYQPDAGMVHADAAIRSLLALAAAHGTEVRERTRVTALAAGGDGVAVATESGTVRAEAVVVTAGAWARPLMATAGIDLPVVPTRETVAYFAMDEAWPPVLVQWEAAPYYALPDPGRGIKAAQHHAGPGTDPDREGEVSEEAVARLSAWVKERFPTADPEPVGAETCLYTNTDDERFILERRGRVVVGSACSGHGFKFAPLIGKRLAALAHDAASGGQSTS